jgi:hypothetical protein
MGSYFISKPFFMRGGNLSGNHYGIRGVYENPTQHAPAQQRRVDACGVFQWKAG